MDDNVVLGLVAVLLGICLWFVIAHVTGLRQELIRIIDGFSPDPFHISDDFKQELYDIMHMALEDTVGSMNIPTAKDHIAGGIMALIQSRFGGLDPRSLIKDAIPSMVYGQEEIEAEETHE